MEHINEFFKRFKNLEIPHKAVLRAAKISIDNAIGGDVPIEHLRCNAGILYIRTHSALRSEILRKKEIVLQQIERELGKRSIRDII